MIYVTSLDGRTKAICRVTLEQLRMLMDWQLRQMDYDPNSINTACRKVDK